jgi:hypothetical protein
MTHALIALELAAHDCLMAELVTRRAALVQAQAALSQGDPFAEVEALLRAQMPTLLVEVRCDRCEMPAFICTCT